MVSNSPPLAIERLEDRSAIRVAGVMARELAEGTELLHVRRLCDDTAIIEHAEGAIPRRISGYCTDDVARQLLVSSLYGRDPFAQVLAEQALSYLLHALQPDGRFQTRMSYARTWIEEDNVDDADGRALWGLGVAASYAPWPHVRSLASTLFDRASSFRSPYWHSTAFAVLGASAVLEQDPDRESAMQLLSAASQTLQPSRGSVVDPIAWPWPEARLSYASALLPDALIALGEVDGGFADDGLALLRWLADHVIVAGRMSVVPAHGYMVGDARPGFDQQPIEAQALASASWRAWILTGEPQWLELLVLSAAWFVGHNDVAVALLDRQTHGCCDGLTATGRNENQGAESTLAMLHTMAILSHARSEGAIVLEGIDHHHFLGRFT